VLWVLVRLVLCSWDLEKRVEARDQSICSLNLQLAAMEIKKATVEVCTCASPHLRLL